MTKKNIFYAQSGGATAVINASACGVIEAAREASQDIGTVFAGKNGIMGALNEQLIDTSQESAEDIAALRHTPASAFGSCRFKLKKIEDDDSEYRRLIDVFAAHDIGYFFYNGGGDSQDTAYKVSQLSEKMQYPLTCIGIPKTIDNDLAFTDNSPGFGSVAKYVAISTQEAALDVACMSATSTKVFVFEVMGRHAGWIAASAGLAAKNQGDAPHIILFPEIPFDSETFLKRTDECVKQYGYCVIVVSEGIKHVDGRFVAESGLSDAFGHQQLGGVAPTLASLIKNKLGHKNHWAVSDYLQRAARHIAAKTDVDQAYALGRAAVEHALKGHNNVMLTIERLAGKQYDWTIGTTPLSGVANVESKMPRDYMTPDGFGITEKCREYLKPLIAGEAYPPYTDGLPQYVMLKNILKEKKLKSIS
jgi:ATP-dependent phosphofructokinase / diphosphate-dependent phosphofructokinase